MPELHTAHGHTRPGWTKIAWLYLMLLPSLLLGWQALTLERALIAATLGLLTLCLGHSVGLHRGIIHGAFQTSRTFRNALVALFILTGLGGPLSWVRLHYVRDYWQNQPDCPDYFAYRHGLVRDFYWNLHLTYVPTQAELVAIPRELSEDPWLRFFERTWPIYTLAIAGLLALIGGWELVVVVVCMRVSAGILGHWFVGIVAHKWGYMRYAIEGAAEEGRNTFVLGLLSFGEGFHNNHHAYPSSARMGHAWWELDLGWLAIRLFERIGLVWNVQAHGRPDSGVKPAARAMPPVWRMG